MSITITPEMVGQTVAVFTSIETKTAEGRLQENQKTWAKNVRAAGGYAGCARTVEQAARIIYGND